MTPLEFEIQMKILLEIKDPEIAHARADELLCELLRFLGYERGVDIYIKMVKWYS